MTKSEYLEFPARFCIMSRLPGGSMHMVRIDTKGMRVLTFLDMFGNKESRCVLDVPLSKIVDAEYSSPLGALSDAKCRLRYLNDAGKEVQLKFHVVDQGVLDGNPLAQERQNQYTEAVAQALTNLKSGSDELPDLPTLTLSPPSSIRKIFYALGLIVGVGILIASFLIQELAVYSFVGALLIFTTVGALLINHVRIRTAWHPVVKLIAYIVLFIIMFVLLIISMFFF